MVEEGATTVYRNAHHSAQRLANAVVILCWDE